MILVTNDDGESEGLRILLEVAKGLGKAYAIVPNRQRSAISGAVTLHKPLRVHEIDKDIYSINGTPADCVLFSVYSGEFEKPKLVLSGINWGHNAGLAPLIGSGTLGACWQAALEGVPGIAFSRFTTSRRWRDRKAWGDRELMKKHVHAVIDKVSKKLEPDSFYSVNLPEDLSSPKIVFTQNLQKMIYNTECTKRLDPHGTPYYWTSSTKARYEEGTDLHEVAVNKNIAVTRISLSFFEGE